ncbi:hypothetical protein P22_1728 [Propionispora sp. 2/2-37]|uniref:hypothetical protein n=1 Tax=Propionispora sp. 2/2-37 TaxID=1677858 RepID=UPI0006C589A3|nr:hypothetical protein [Propionispora sp. 2/2-37]CUH95654.1 hypothetical protein P22_1728 [Propionispora sp. 2/2-37]
MKVLVDGKEQDLDYWLDMVAMYFHRYDDETAIKGIIRFVHKTKILEDEYDYE